MSKIFKQSLMVVLLLVGTVQQAWADNAPEPEAKVVSDRAPAQPPVHLGWDRVGDRERNWV